MQTCVVTGLGGENNAMLDPTLAVWASMQLSWCAGPEQLLTLPKQILLLSWYMLSQRTKQQYLGGIFSVPDDTL